MEIAKIIVTIVEVLVSVALILVVLFQSGKEAGLSGAIAGGSDTYMSKGKSSTMDQKLAKATKWIALVWILLVLTLNILDLIH